jgi:oligopeptide transport system substrate-binding protein
MLYNGPYVQKGWTGSNLSWKMVKNKYYWDKKNVKIQQIDWSVQKTPSTAYNLYQSNKLDALSLDSSQTKQLAKKPGFQLINNGGTAYLQYNLQKDQNLASVNIRRAISMAIDRFGLCSTLGGNNQPAKTFTAKGVMYVGGSEYTSGVAKTSEAYNKYSKTEAKKLFNKGLAELGKSSITISIMADDTDSGKKTVEALQSELTQTLGKIKVETTTVPFKTRMARREEGKFDVMVSTWIADFNDAISFLDLLTSNNSRNYGKWSNSEYDRLIADSKTTASSSQRVSDLQKAEAILLEDEGITPIYYISTAYLIRPEINNVYNDNLGGWQFKYASVK